MKLWTFVFLLLAGCNTSSPESRKKATADSIQNQTRKPGHIQPFIAILGTAQDAGYPHFGCRKECCKAFYEGKEPKHLVSCLALIDPQSGKRWIFDCTPDFTAQMHGLDTIFPSERNVPDGIFLTHGHIGHYTGLMYLGKEALNAKEVPVYGMADMTDYLKNNGPWSQLVKINNIELHTLQPDSALCLNERISVTPFFVPHRHEFTQAVGYRISIPGKNIIFIPDIDKWDKWERDIKQLVKANDLLFLDGTFYKEGEIAGRNMSEIPHPFIQESMVLFEGLSPAEKGKIHFIHLNHTNPALRLGSEARKDIKSKGFDVVKEGDIF